MNAKNQSGGWNIPLPSQLPNKEFERLVNSVSREKDFNYPLIHCWTENIIAAKTRGLGHRQVRSLDTEERYRRFAYMGRGVEERRLRRQHMAPWGDDAKLGSGLPDRFLLTITRARMETPEGWSNDSVVLSGEQNVDGELSDGDLRLSVGAFEKGDKEGTFLVHQTQRPEIFDTHYERIKKINKNSGYGRFLDSALGVVPLEENQAADRAKYEIWDLLMWEGLTVDVEMRERAFTYQQDVGNHKAGDPGTTRDAYVVGFVEGGSTSASSSATSTENSPSPSTNGTINPADYDSFIAYVEAASNAGQANVSKPEWEQSRAG